MGAYYTFSKGLTRAQAQALESARIIAGLTEKQLKDDLFREFCAKRHVVWPGTQQHGGKREKRITR